MSYRVYMIAYRKELGAVVQFPRATLHCDLPRGYAGTRAVSLKLINSSEGCAFIKPDTGHKGLPHAVTAREAIGDLPPVTSHLEGTLKRGARRFTEPAYYRRTAWDNLSSYAQLMRSWPGFTAGDAVYDHVLRYLPRDSRIFKAMAPGDEYPQAHRLAEKMFKAAASRRKLSPKTAEWRSLRDSLVPPYDPSKFPNRWWKLRANGPVRTLTAHIGKDTYTHIHYDSDQARVITVREAARLQSFPDGFVFAGTMNPAFRQIGNAVPPVMARELAFEIISSLRNALIPAAAAE